MRIDATSTYIDVFALFIDDRVKADVYPFSECAVEAAINKYIEETVDADQVFIVNRPAIMKRDCWTISESDGMGGFMSPGLSRFESVAEVRAGLPADIVAVFDKLNQGPAISVLPDDDG